MSTFPDTAVDNRRSGKAPEKSNFTQTCNLLSQFLKEKRTLGMVGKKEPRVSATTMDLLRNLQNPDDALRQNASTMDLLPQFVDNPCIKQSLPRSPAPETPPLTILYAGKVLVFDAFSPEKATEIMELASKLGSHNYGDEEKVPCASVAAENLNAVEVSTSKTAQKASQRGPQTFGLGMRYPASLLKFLEKRKERIIARGPYQITKHEGDSGGDLEECSKHFDLNL